MVETPPESTLWGSEPRSYSLAAGVSAMRDGKLLMLERGAGDRRAALCIRA